MSLLEWKAAYNLGIEKIDLQHQGLFDMVNEMYDAMLSGKVKTVLSQIIIKLEAYTRQHFIDEEALMTLYRYPDMDEHIKEHKDFIAKVKDFKEKYEKGTVLLSIDIVNFLENWLINHICGCDKRISIYIKQKING